MGIFATRSRYFCFESTLLSDSVYKIFLFGELIFGLRNDSSFLLNSHLGLRKAGVLSNELLMKKHEVHNWILTGSVRSRKMATSGAGLSDVYRKALTFISIIHLYGNSMHLCIKN